MANPSKQPSKRRILKAVFIVLIILAIGLGIGLGVGLTRHNSSSPTSPNAALNATLFSIRSRYHLPCLTIGHGSTSPSSFRATTVGVRKIDSPIPALPTDIYHLGSLTKAMTATVLALLIQSSANNTNSKSNNTPKISWTSTLPDLLPGFNISTTHASTTLQDLTSHRSGILDSSYPTPLLLSLYNESAVTGRQILANRSLSLPRAGPRGNFTYANANYILAGLIIDVAVSKQGGNGSATAESYIQSHLFDALGMTSAGWGAVPERNNTSIDNPWPHTVAADGVTPVPYRIDVPNAERDNPPAFNTAGRVHARPADYEKFLRVHLAAMVGDGDGDGETSNENGNALGLSASQLTHLHTAPDWDNDSGPGEGFTYTYGGWLRANFSVNGQEKYILAHDGSNRLNYAWVELDGNVGEAYMALTNVGGQDAALGAQEAIIGMRNGTLNL